MFSAYATYHVTYSRVNINNCRCAYRLLQPRPQQHHNTNTNNTNSSSSNARIAHGNNNDDHNDNGKPSESNAGAARQQGLETRLEPQVRVFFIKKLTSTYSIENTVATSLPHHTTNE